MTHTKLDLGSPYPIGPQQKMWLFLESLSWYVIDLVFRHLYEIYNGWSIALHYSATWWTSSMRFSVVVPSAARMIVLWIHCMLFSFLSTSRDRWWASSVQSYVHIEMICAFLHCSSIYPYKSVPSWRWKNYCTGAKVHSVALISSNCNFLSLISTSIFYTSRSFCNKAHTSIVSSKSWLHSLTTVLIWTLAVLMVASRSSQTSSVVVGCNFI